MLWHCGLSRRLLAKIPKVPGKSVEGGLGDWALPPMGEDLNGSLQVPGFSLAIWDVNQQIEDFFLFLPLSL